MGTLDNTIPSVSAEDVLDVLPACCWVTAGTKDSLLLSAFAQEDSHEMECASSRNHPCCQSSYIRHKFELVIEAIIGLLFACTGDLLILVEHGCQYSSPFNFSDSAAS